jgi:hypothetical protein
LSPSAARAWKSANSWCPHRTPIWLGQPPARPSFCWLHSYFGGDGAGGKTKQLPWRPLPERNQFSTTLRRPGPLTADIVTSISCRSSIRSAAR